MATTATLTRLERPRTTNDYDAAYLTLCFTVHGFFMKNDLASRRRRCAEVAYSVDATKLHRFRLTPAEVVKLFAELGFERYCHPIFTYDAKRQILVVRNTQSSAHDEVHRAWMKVLGVPANIDLRHHGITVHAIPFRAHIPSKETAERIMSGDPVATADWTLYMDNAAQSVWSSDIAPVRTPRLVVCIGLQDDGHAELVRDVGMWLETMESVTRVVLVTIVEEPRYSCPIPFGALNNADLPPRDDFKDLLYPHGDHHVMPPLTGPINFAGHCWTGKITHVWNEIWSRRETKSGWLPSLEEGSRQDLLAEDEARPCELVLQAFASPELPFTRELARQKMTLNKSEFRKEFLSSAARDLALQRYDRVQAVQAILRGTSYRDRLWGQD